MAEITTAGKKDEEASITEQKSAPAKARGPVLIIVLVALNFVVMVSVAVVMWEPYKGEKAKLEEAIQNEKQEIAQTKDDYIGSMIPLETFLVNLPGSRGNKLVKTSLEFEVSGFKIADEIERRSPQIRDMILILLSNKSYDELITTEGKENLRIEVRDTINSFLVKGRIKKVYLTDFIVN